MICRSDANELELYEAIVNAADNLNRDELRIVAFVIDGLNSGRSEYGPLDFKRERPWSREVCEEYRDAVVYWAAMTLAMAIDKGELK